MLNEEERLEVERLGSRKDVGGVAFELLRIVVLFTVLSLLTMLGGRACGAVAVVSAFLGDPLVLLRSGTMVVTPLILLDSEAEE